MPACLEMLHPIYERLGILPFDHEHGESFYNPMLAGRRRGPAREEIAVESKGAVVIPNAKGIIPQTEEEQKKEEPPAILRKRDGAFTYTTTDLATIKYRVEHVEAGRDAVRRGLPQALHFKTLFAQARRWGYDTRRVRAHQFGSMLGKDRKPFGDAQGRRRSN